MSKLIFYRNFNNYINRINKHTTSLTDFVGYDNEIVSDTNFNPNDDTVTEHIINWPSTTTWHPDYMLNLDNDNNIISKWFVIEFVRTRGGQYNATLRRDIIDDKYNNVINAPIYIERAMINNVNNPLLYNNEGFSFNQIKKEEQLIKDATRSAWYILYFKKGLASKTITFNPKAGIEDHTISTTIANSIFGTQGNLYQTSDIVPMITYRKLGGFFYNTTYRLAVEDSGLSFYTVEDDGEVIWFDQNSDVIKTQLTDAFENSYNTLKQNVLDDNNFTQVTSAQEQYLSWDNTLVKDANNKLYRVHITKNPYSRWKYVTSGAMVNTMKSLINGTSLTKTGDWGDDAFAVKYNNIEYSFSYEEVTDPTGFSINIEWGSNAQTENSDYNIVAIPYNTVPIEIGQDNVYLQQDWSKALLNAIMASYTVDSELVDIQLLPYFPVVKAHHYPIENLDSKEYTVVADSENARQGIGIFYVSSANFTFNHSVRTVLTTSDDPIERKIQNETQMVRLCSPNYNGVFEFNVAKNGGVDYLNIDVTLKPYNPYIHINPNFNNLYGQDFDDARGLICGGDFSIPIWSTAWQQYELQNKNYKNIFDRQIQNIDFVQGQERTQAIWNIFGGTIQGGVQGGIAGGMMGGAYGAIAGAVIGTTASAVGGAIDYSMLVDRQLEQKSYMQDMFKYQLGNIKALPYSLSKVTPLTYNNKIWPFIEIYGATDEEENILANYLNYQSMTINAIGHIEDYQQQEKTFIKGLLIRIENLDATSHEAMEIYKELEKGVYI